MMAVNTKLFNIRITYEKHAKFKAFAEKNNVSMGSLLSGYIDRLLDGSEEPPAQKGQRAKWEDPMDEIRNQYVEGRDY
jgi:hypothetical protein|tara:strand:- start:3010 stop:3243 length:234 start_codon:yes stop_codon:yes gene_type:complete